MKGRDAMSEPTPDQLPRRLNLAAAVATFAGFMIVSGIFLVPA